MSGLAEILLDEGFSISGSDSHETALTEHLEKKGARVYYGQRAANIEREPGISVWCILQLSMKIIRSSGQPGIRGCPCFPGQSFWGS